jgi:pimeloyl-ACP methyl ester carboxylesterase
MAQELNAKLDILPNCGHCPNEDDPELTAKVIADFWIEN